MRTIAIVNRKGGSCKTTTTVELAHILATVCRKRVLVMDLDSQADTTYMMLGRTAEEGAGTADVLRMSLDYYPDVIWPTDISGLDIIPATEELASVDMDCMLGRMKPNFHRLQGLILALMEDDAYDIVLMDCPPNYNAACINAIVACDYVLIPTTLDDYSLNGMKSLLYQIRELRTGCPQVNLAGVLVVKYRNFEGNQKTLAELRANSPIRVFQTVIRCSDEKMEDANRNKKTAQQWSPFCNCAKDYRALARELMELGVLPHE